ncbi:hypothetical protein E4U41_007049 [Claviceps citrina]|nr:hypothetical protein E4U41_007049 [Claviceps citrina]
MNLTIGALFPLRWRLWLGKLLFRPMGPFTFRVSWHRVIKGPCNPTEVEAMQYVASHTTIPIPKLYAVHQDNGRIYIEMSYIKGTTLDDAWWGLSTDQKNTIYGEVKQYISILRELPPPVDDIVSSAFQNPAYDVRLGFQFFGPMSHYEFHSALRGHLHVDDVAPHLGEATAQVHFKNRYRTCFTHADLAARNIMVKDGHVAAIIDWAFSGWYPEYWEFTKAYYNLAGCESQSLLISALPSYETELAAERVIWRKLPEMGDDAGHYRNGVYTKHKGSEPSKAWLDARKGRKQTDLWAVVLANFKYLFPELHYHP